MLELSTSDADAVSGGDAFKYCPEMIFVSGERGQLLRWSDTLRQEFGAKLRRGTRLATLAHPDDREAIDAAWAALEGGAEGAQSVIRMRVASGEYRPFLCRMRMDSRHGAVHGSLSEERATNGASNGASNGHAKNGSSGGGAPSKEEILQLIIDHLSIVAWAVDAQGTFIYHDGKGVEAAGQKRGELLDKNIFELYADDEQTMSGMRRALAGEVVHVFTEAHGAAWESWYLPKRDKRGKVVAILGVTIDVTDVKRAEKLLLEQRAEIIEKQQAVIRELSTPILQVWDGVLALPLVGVVDTTRAAEVMSNLLSEIVRTHARYAILDLTGVEIVDTGTASHLINLIQAVRLLGAEGIITGIRPAVAQTMVGLGVDMARLLTLGNLQQALMFCMSRLGGGAQAVGASPPSGAVPLEGKATRASR